MTPRTRIWVRAFRDDDGIWRTTVKVEIGIPLAERQRIIFERMRRG